MNKGSSIVCSRQNIFSKYVDGDYPWTGLFGALRLEKRTATNHTYLLDRRIVLVNMSSLLPF